MASKKPRIRHEVDDSRERDETQRPAEGAEAATVDNQAARIALKTELLAAIEANMHLLESSPIKFRLSQSRALDAFKKKLEDDSWDLRGYFVQPTGAGKTVLFGIMARLLTQPTVIFVPRTSLLEQTRKELVETCGFASDDIGLIGEGNKEFGGKVTICTYQSHNSLIESKNRDYQSIWDNAKIVICDEAHRSLGEATRKKLVTDADKDEAGEEDIIATDEQEEDVTEEGVALTPAEEEAEDIVLQQISKRRKTALKLGFTATPKLSGKHIEAAFGTEIARESYADLVKAKILAKYKIVHTEGDLILGEDFTSGAITEEREVEILNREDTYRKLLQKYVGVNKVLPRKLKTIVFCANKKECDNFIAKAEAEFGLKCIKVTSDEDTGQKATAEQGLMEGTFDMVVTVEKLTEGWNFPPLDAAMRARANASPANILQGCGRASRAYPGKNYAYVFETDWKVSLRVTMAAEGAPTRDREQPSGIEAKKKVVKRFNFFEALLANGESREDLPDICSFHDESETYEFLPSSGKMDRAYFENAENVRKDLSDYAQVYGITVNNINCNKIASNKEVICANGELVKAITYFRRAAFALGLASNMTEAAGKVGEAIIMLKQLLGIEVTIYPKMDRQYFDNLDYVRADLTAYASAIGKSIEDITTMNIKNEQVNCANGEPVSGQTYLHRAKIEEESRYQTLIRLKKSIGIEVTVYAKMDRAYFDNLKNLEYDLSGYAQAAECHVADLNTGKLQRVRILCMNGEPVRGVVFLDRAVKAFSPPAKNHSQILKDLKKKLGIEVKEYPFMDKAYFENLDNVRTDFTTYAAAIGVDIKDVNTSNILDTEVICSNGEPVLGETYFRRAGKAFDIDKKQRALILNRLRKILGIEIKEYPPMDKAYFENADNVCADLTIFAAAIGTTVENLNSGNILDDKADCICANGEKLKAKTYLNRARMALATSAMKFTEILATLKKAIGIDVKEHPPMDRAYFENPDNVRKDLAAYSTKSNTSVESLSTTQMRSAEVVCANGELVKGQAYLQRAIALLTNGTEKIAAILLQLKKTAGIEIKVRAPKMDRAYFENPNNTRHDLAAFAVAAATTIDGLNTGNIQLKTALCSNGEEVKSQAFLDRARTVLGVTTLTEALSKLKSIIGM